MRAIIVVCILFCSLHKRANTQHRHVFTPTSLVEAFKRVRTRVVVVVVVVRELLFLVTSVICV